MVTSMVTSRGRRRVFGLGAVLLVFGSAGCAPDDATGDPSAVPANGGTTTPIPDHPITPAEVAAGANDPGDDQVAPWAGIDGDVQALAPMAVAGGDDGSAETASRVDGLAACRPAQGYSYGVGFTVCVTELEGHLVEYRTAAAYLRLKAAAGRDGVSIHINSGFRTMDQQRALYAAYRAGRGNLAAAPGYSNHQSGLALDLNTEGPGVYSWLTSHGGEYGFRRTVPSEIWHWERIGSATGGSTGSGSSGGGGSTAPSGCFSNTLNSHVDQHTCVQSRFDGQWYQCVDGGWRVGRATFGACSSDHPLPGGGGNCYSSTLGRDVGQGTCLQSRLDSAWYQCTGGGWSLDASIPRTHNGPGGHCSEVLPLQ